MNQSVPSIISHDSQLEHEPTIYSEEECLVRYAAINDSDPLLYESYELGLATERIANKFLPYSEEVPPNTINREIITRLHGDAPVQKLYSIIDSISFQDVPDQSTVFTIFAHNLNDETLEAAYEIAHKSGGCIRIVSVNDENTRGAFYSGQMAWMSSKGRNIAMVDSDGYAYPDWSNTMFETLEGNPNLAGVSGDMKKIEGGILYNAAVSIRSLVVSKERGFRAGSSAYNGDTIRNYANSIAGRLTEDGGFASTYHNQIAHDSRALVINSAAKFKDMDPFSIFNKGLYALRRSAVRNQSDITKTTNESRKIYNAYLKDQVRVYAPWTSPFIDIYYQKEHITFDDLAENIKQLPLPEGVSLNSLRSLFNQITVDGETDSVVKVITFLEEFGQRVYGPIIKQNISQALRA